MSSGTLRPPLVDENGEARELTDEDFALARRGAPWMWKAQEKAAAALRDAARNLRAEADRLEKEAERLAAGETV